MLTEVLTSASPYTPLMLVMVKVVNIPSTYWKRLLAPFMFNKGSLAWFAVDDPDEKELGHTKGVKATIPYS